MTIWIVDDNARVRAIDTKSGVEVGLRPLKNGETVPGAFNILSGLSRQYELFPESVSDRISFVEIIPENTRNYDINETAPRCWISFTII